MSSACNQRKFRDLLPGLLFLSPNILGFLAFTLIPVVYSFVLAFTDMDLKRNNLFHNQPIQFVGLENFHRLFEDPNFWKFFENTWFFMLGLPVNIAASLVAAILLSKDLKPHRRRFSLAIIGGAVLVGGISLLTAIGAGATAMVLVLIAVGGGILVLGASLGNSVYRTLFYVPNFISGVATFLLWKKFFNPETGPMTALTRPFLASLSDEIHSLSPLWFTFLGRGLLWLAAAIILLHSIRHLRELLEDDVPPPPLKHRRMGALAHAIVYCICIAAIEISLIALAALVAGLPAIVNHGGALRPLEPPDWLGSTAWAKPSMMFMGFWAAVGSNTMLLYLAALTTVPPELGEAAEIDGAGRLSRFWNVTWPQLAPTTFFVIVMGVIGGLQGGFEAAKAMTNGGPAGSTTTLSFFIYTEGFVTGRLGYSSAIAWLMFLMVLVITLVNVKFGNSHVND